MPLIESVTDPVCGNIVSRFTFERTAGPSTGFKDAGVYYTLTSGQTAVATAGTFGLGIGGYLNPNPPRNFRFNWQPLARSVPAPLVLGTKTPYAILVEQLYYQGRNVHEIEQFLTNIPEAFGPYQGTIHHYKQDGTTKFLKYTNSYYRNLIFQYDGNAKFVEYALLFETVDTPAVDT